MRGKGCRLTLWRKFREGEKSACSSPGVPIDTRHPQRAADWRLLLQGAVIRLSDLEDLGNYLLVGASV
jgi:hypothetical protein